MEKYIGIDYGLGKTNIDHKTGIRYGIISANELNGDDLSEFLPDYGDTSDMSEQELDFAEPLAHTYEDKNYSAQLDSSNDVWLFKSSYYTHAMFCSPCAPGACTMSSPVENGAKCYCFNHDWFENGIAPYPVYRISDNSLVQPKGKL